MGAAIWAAQRGRRLLADGRGDWADCRSLHPVHVDPGTDMHNARLSYSHLLRRRVTMDVHAWHAKSDTRVAYRLREVAHARLNRSR